MPFHLVLHVLAKILIPYVLLFALYVQFHGDFGPGGGFQAGVIFATGHILYALIFGLDRARRVLPPPLMRVLAAGGVLLYAGVGFTAVMLGGNFLDYDTLAESKLAGQHLGIMLVELGVGVTVTSVIVSLLYSFMD